MKYCYTVFDPDHNSIWSRLFHLKEDYYFLDEVVEKLKSVKEHVNVGTYSYVKCDNKDSGLFYCFVHVSTNTNVNIRLSAHSDKPFWWTLLPWNVWSFSEEKDSAMRELYEATIHIFEPLEVV